MDKRNRNWYWTCLQWYNWEGIFSLSFPQTTTSLIFLTFSGKWKGHKLFLNLIQIRLMHKFKPGLWCSWSNNACLFKSGENIFPWNHKLLMMEIITRKVKVNQSILALLTIDPKEIIMVRLSHLSCDNVYAFAFVFALCFWFAFYHYIFKNTMVVSLHLNIFAP